MRLIDADKFVHDLEYCVELCARTLDDMNMIGKERKNIQFQKDCKQNCIWYISEQPTVDAEPIRHGRWDYVTVVDDGFWRCSNCGASSEALGTKYLYRYCPFCGAKMDGEQEKQK